MEFETFVEYAAEVEATASDDETTALVADLLAAADDDLAVAARFVQGRVFPAWTDRTTDVGTALLYEAMAKATGCSTDAVEDAVAEAGGVGVACERLFAGDDAGQQTLTDLTGSDATLTLSDVSDTFEALDRAAGSDSQSRKVAELTALLRDCAPVEAKYATRLVLGEMRIGVGEGIVRDAVADAFDVAVDHVEWGLMVTNDVGAVAEAARSGGDDALADLEIEVGRPVAPMLAGGGSMESVLEDVSSGDPVAVEYKYDGARLQIHVADGDVTLFTRGFSDVTDSLPDVVSAVEASVTAETAVLDAEVVAYESEAATNPLPFTEVMKRVGREHGIDEKRAEIRLDVHVFDALFVDGRPLVDAPLRDRRRALAAVCNGLLTDQYRTDDPDRIAALERDAVGAGHEGLLVKNPDAAYRPGDRGKEWLKLKPEPETLDCVVVGGEWGEGRRANLIGSFRLAVRAGESGDLREVGQVATGLTDEELASLTERFEPLVEQADGATFEVRPEVVFEIGYEEIQPSPTYDSGYALRFPRFVGVREDLPVAEADTLDRLEALADD